MKYVEPDIIRPHMSIVRAVSKPCTMNRGIVACHTQTPHSIAIDVKMYLSYKRNNVDALYKMRMFYCLQLQIT